MIKKIQRGNRSTILLRIVFFIFMTIFLGCSNFPKTYNENDSYATSTIHQDAETKNFIVTAMGWDNLKETPELKCQTANLNAQMKIMKKFKKDPAIYPQKKNEYYDKANKICLSLLSIELSPKDFTPNQEITYPTPSISTALIKNGKVKSLTPPIYPRQAREQRLEGIAVIQLTIEVDGNPSNIHVLQTSGHKILDEQAQLTVEEWRFYPAEILGKPIKQLVNIPIRFQLSNKNFHY
jgi:protein TonB